MAAVAETFALAERPGSESARVWPGRATTDAAPASPDRDAAVAASEPEDRVIAGGGTPEADWQAWPGLHDLPACRLDALVPPGRRAVVVSPHPDDEVLAFGGLLALLAAQGAPTLVLAVTEGEASHPGSAQWSPPDLARRRAQESRHGLRLLGVPQQARVSMGLADGGVAAGERELHARLLASLRPDDVVFSTWAWDGHPDHEASARATAAACAAVGCRHVESPVWMWHWAAPGDARVPWARMRRLALPATAMALKARAIHAHATQLAAQDTGAPPVLPPTALHRLIRPHEYFIVPDGTRP